MLTSADISNNRYYSGARVSNAAQRVSEDPTCGGEAGSLAGSPSLDAVLPNSRHPDALWDSTLGSLDFLENRLLKEEERARFIITILIFLHPLNSALKKKKPRGNILLGGKISQNYLLSP